MSRWGKKKPEVVVPSFTPHHQDKNIRKGRNGFYWGVCVCHHMTTPVKELHDARYLLNQHVALERSRERQQ